MSYKYYKFLFHEKEGKKKKKKVEATSEAAAIFFPQEEEEERGTFLTEMADEEKPSMDHLTFSVEEEEGIVKIQAMVSQPT
jgi:hypothetical protein